MMSVRPSRKKTLLIGIFAFQVFLAAHLSAQPTQLPAGFDLISTEDSLSQRFIAAIFQDSRGFMWFGTRDGLNRYDGYDFKIYRHNPFDSTTISGNWVTAICEGCLGYLKEGTRKGQNRFDSENFGCLPDEKFNRIWPTATKVR